MYSARHRSLDLVARENKHLCDTEALYFKAAVLLFSNFGTFIAHLVLYTFFD